MNIPPNHSSIWYSPSPGQSPRLDPKKFRESMKLNLSTEVFLTLTKSLNIKLNKLPLYSVVIFSATWAVVLRQGSRQSDTRFPINKSSVRKFSEYSTHCIVHTFNFNLEDVSVVIRLQVKIMAGITDVVHSPERLVTRREGSFYKIIIAISIALIILCRIVHTWVSGVLGRILFLAKE